MKTTIKYEWVINEALRSAMNYEAPDDQINEFIRLFGKYLGSDRVYIFEDDLAMHTTSNTYEWCAEGIEPQIGMLQNVDMDTIDWWYECFGRGESVFVPDVEELKDTHSTSYEILRAQNIHCLTVTPLRYTDEICGFVGVDNPPVDDFDEVAVFLNMMGTLLISWLKMRNSFIRSSEAAKFDSYRALSEIYQTMNLIDMKTGKFQPVKSTPFIDASRDPAYGDDFQKQIRTVMGVLCTGKYVQSVLEFTDISTLEERLADKNMIDHEYLGNVSGWCKERFIVVDRSVDGSLSHVLYCVEVIDEEKRRENRLLYLSQTDVMTGLYNRGSGENKVSELLRDRTGGLLCLLDCDKFKSINDTYGHAVGDSVLIALSDGLQSACRESDVVLRLGGDEFAIYIPGMLDEKMANMFIRRLFGRLERIRIPEMGEKKIYVSLGASFFPGTTDVTFEQLYRQADQAMYQSKRTAGYCATIYQDLLCAIGKMDQ